MSLHDALVAIVLGLVEGVTEFIPVSSSGHLIVATEALGLHADDPKMVVFNIVIQLAAILAVVWIYRAKILDLLRRLPRDPVAQRFAMAVVVATLPAAIIGLKLDDWIEANLFSTKTVAWALIVGGIGILLVERFASTRRSRVPEMEDIRLGDALKVGLAQCLALFPGVSRSGATIMGGMGFGLSRRAATEFSFFLAIPVMVGASLLKLVKERDALAVSDVPFFALGCLVAFLSALVVVRFLIRFVATNSFNRFAWYRIAVGAVLLGLIALGWMPG
ncbi:MAG: undecaprenyl-diphosphate phosphatase [Rhodothermales bacterium]|nr:undecaprenyl-diphosphate phosphatase [Rhodothermales bacterium]